MQRDAQQAMPAGVPRHMNPQGSRENMQQRSSFSVLGILCLKETVRVRENPSSETKRCCGDHWADMIENSRKVAYQLCGICERLFSLMYNGD